MPCEIVPKGGQTLSLRLTAIITAAVGASLLSLVEPWPQAVFAQGSAAGQGVGVRVAARVPSTIPKYQTASARGLEPNTAMGLARRLYQARRYNEAAEYFRYAVEKDGAGAGGNLWIAHCYYALGNIKAAVAEYRAVADKYLGTAESKQARLYLTRLDPTGKLQGGGRAARPGGTLISPTGAAGGRIIASMQTQNIADRIDLVKPIVGHPELSPATISLVRENIRRLPEGVQNLLTERGISICITPTLVDKFPELSLREGRGYDGHTYKTCPGMFKDNTVYICERTIDEGSNEVLAPIPPGRVTDTFYHEVGHALDYCLNNLSSSEEFRHAYYLDIARIPPDAAGRLSYFMQKSLAGQQESCGEITGVCLGGACRSAADVRAFFPLSLNIIKSKLNSSGLTDDPQGAIAGRSDSHHM